MVSNMFLMHTDEAFRHTQHERACSILQCAPVTLTIVGTCSGYCPPGTLFGSSRYRLFSLSGSCCDMQAEREAHQVVCGKLLSALCRGSSAVSAAVVKAGGNQSLLALLRDAPAAPTTLADAFASVDQVSSV